MGNKWNITPLTYKTLRPNGMYKKYGTKTYNFFFRLLTTQIKHFHGAKHDMRIKKIEILRYEEN